MPFPHVTAPHPRKESNVRPPSARDAADRKEVVLTESDFQDLLQLPSCKISGHCDRCGRCEQ